jgi:integrase
MKNNQAFESVLPASTTKLIELYRERYRPQLVSTSNPWLFPGVGDRPKSCERLAMQITDCVRRRCGLRVHLHLFRHLSAKLFLDAHPGQYGVIRLLHGHKSVETTTRFYCQIEATNAVKIYDHHVMRLRVQSPVLPTGGK